jgi:hypothetical protein
VLHATNWAGLHEGISVLNISAILVTEESAGEVSEISEEVWMVLTPFEVNVEKKDFLFIDIGEFSGLLLDIWLSVVVDVDIVWIKLSVWVHDVHGEWIELKSLATLDFHLRLWEGCNFNKVLSVYFVSLLSWLSSSIDQMVVWVVLECNLLLAVVTSVGHTVTFNEELAGTLWRDESWLDTEDEWIDIAEFNVIIGPVETVETDINIEGLRGWILWVGGVDLTT